MHAYGSNGCKRSVVSMNVEFGYSVFYSAQLDGLGVRSEEINVHG